MEIMQTLLLLLAVSCISIKFVGACKEFEECTLSDGSVGICNENTCLAHIVDEQRENLQFTITVKYPENILQSHGETALYIRGNGLGLLWIKGSRLLKIGNDLWGLDITYKASYAGYKCQSCLDDKFLPDNKLQYRIFADDRVDMLGANFVINFPLSGTSSYFDNKPVFTSYPWFYEKTGDIRSYVIQSAYIGYDRNFTLYTPPSFNENTYKTYPTIFGFDLDLKIAKFLKFNFEAPIYPHATAEEYAIIGFGDYRNEGKERTDLLTQTVGPNVDCINGTFSDNCNGCIPVDVYTNITAFYHYLENGCGVKSNVGGLGDRTLDFLEKEALPFANKQASSRLQTEKLGVIGYSLGGLMSCYAIWSRPSVYSVAACQSPSVWWPFNINSFNLCDFDFLNKTLKDSSLQSNRPEQRIYLDAGGNEYLDPFRLTQATDEAARVIAGFERYELDKNVWMAVDPFKNHTFIEWGKRMGQALTTLLPAGGGQSMPSNEAMPVG